MYSTVQSIIIVKKMVYCGTIVVDNCPAERLLEHFLEFTEKIILDLKLILHIGMDGPSVNLKFEDLLKSSPHMKSLGTTILSIGTGPLHIVHNAFRAGVNPLNFNIDSFIIDVNFFFKLFLSEIYGCYFTLYTETFQHKVGYTQKDMC